ncbi:MAG: hypothetical protein LAQ69_01915 [Acidobacteriia bacterium]|nr:hypothetical protein [Terriglobia bacterium]
METLAMPVAEELAEASSGDEVSRPRFEEELDILAFELWQRGSRQDLAADEGVADDEETVGCHASCL